MSGGECRKCLKVGNECHLCDKCGSKFCEKCLSTYLTSTEMRALQIKKDRRLFFFCTPCRARNYEEKNIADVVKSVFEAEIVRIRELHTQELADLDMKIKRMIEVEVEKVRNTPGQDATGSTYSMATKRMQAEPPIVVIPRVEQRSTETKKDIKNNINPMELGVGVSQLREISKGQVIIRSNNQRDRVKLQEEIQSKMSDKYEIRVIKMKTPKIRIAGIRREDDEEDEVLVRQIIEQNGLDTKVKDFKVKILRKIFSKRYPKTMSMILDVDAVTYRSLMERERINLGWSVVKVEDYIGVVRCYKCLGYNHFAKECTKRKACYKCSSEHNGRDCNIVDNFQCVNCREAIEKLNLNLKSDHVAFSYDCPCYQRVLKIQQSKVKYDTDE